MSRYIPRLAEHKSCEVLNFLFLWCLFRRFSETKPFGYKRVQLKEFGRKIKCFFRQFTFVITRPKRCRKPLQTMIDGNLGNVTAGVSISIIAHPMQTVVRPNLVPRAISAFKMAGGGEGPGDEVVLIPSFFPFVIVRSPQIFALK